ncbi:hypothetical protein FAES_0221 [Fibrella aestuarina BUZ 2]|uniref:BioF2-like acetyltransferase domain-containing protein n=1 Tax=Fibrella aestuarina BUZ 2 TaxID=1166018 RepID=I0K282_9BACT|nr:hypothetical protein [Fibrella aestuarina]CCG98235.1 hypothetical protein FAES_0221 [Fibrella aestuarina BUZ 2]
MYHIVTHNSASTPALPAYSEAGFWFNEEAQLRQQDGGNFRLLTVHNPLTRLADARCALFIDDQLATSPKAAPFGSIEFVEALPDSALHALIDSLEAEVQHLNVPTLRLTNYPHAYAARQAERLVGLLRRRGYRVADQFLNFHIDVSAQPLAGKLHRSERRRLAKCLRSGFTVAHWAQPPVAEVVRFIERSRQQQGYPLTILPDRLAQLLKRFPEQYPVFAVWDGSTLASLTVAVRVRHDILYNFLPADNQHYRTFSPAVLLTQGLYTFCQQHAITLLDLGVCLDAQRAPKPSLMRFKRNLGATASWKVVLEKQLQVR